MAESGMALNILLIAAFCLMQAAATLIFKHGSSGQGSWAGSFVAANAITIASAWLLMLLYKRMNANTAMGILIGLSFVLSQISLSVVFKSPLSGPQISGICLICAGLLLFCK